MIMGLEFRGRETEEVLEEMGINHVYSSPYCPQSNGAVERTNQTITGIIKGLTDNILHWDRVLSKAIITYNSTFHSQLKTSPTEFLLNNNHNPSNYISLPSQLQQTWREGNPNFKSFKIGDKVIKEIVRPGDRASYKLLPKFEGPYVVRKVYENGVSYEIEKEEGVVVKSHHRKLRRYHDLQFYLRKHIENEVELSCRVVNEEVSMDRIGIGSVPVELSSESEEESLFEGFGSAGIKEQSVKNRYRKDVVEKEREKTRKVVEKSLTEFHCTEVIEAQEPLQSTLLEKGEEARKVLGEYVNKEIMDKFFIVEQSIMVQEEILEKTESIVQEYLEGINEESNIFNQPIVGTKFSGVELGEEVVIHDESLESYETGETNFGSVASKGREGEHVVQDDREDVIEVCSQDYGANEIEGTQIGSEDVLNVNRQVDSCSGDFMGFNGSERSANALSKLSEIRGLINESRRNLREGRTRSQDLRRRLMDYRESKSFNTTGNSTLASNISQELGDYLTELRPGASSTPRVLRSHGAVKDIANVQPTVLEYRLRKLNL